MAPPQPPGWQMSAYTAAVAVCILLTAYSIHSFAGVLNDERAAAERLRTDLSAQIEQINAQLAKCAARDDVNSLIEHMYDTRDNVATLQSAATALSSQITQIKNSLVEYANHKDMHRVNTQLAAGLAAPETFADGRYAHSINTGRIFNFETEQFGPSDIVEPATDGNYYYANGGTHVTAARRDEKYMANGTMFTYSFATLSWISTSDEVIIRVHNEGVVSCGSNTFHKGITGTTGYQYYTYFVGKCIVQCDRRGVCDMLVASCSEMWMEDAALATNDRYIFVAGGIDVKTQSNCGSRFVSDAMSMYDLRRGKWTSAPPMTTARSAAAAAAYLGIVYITGGNGNRNTKVLVVESYHILSGVWREYVGIADMKPRSGHFSYIHAGMLYVIGGSAVRGIEVYDFGRRGWRDVDHDEKIGHVIVAPA